MKSQYSKFNIFWKWVGKEAGGAWLFAFLFLLSPAVAQATFCGDNCLSLDLQNVDKSNCSEANGVTTFEYLATSSPECGAIDSIKIEDNGFCSEIVSVSDDNGEIPECDGFHFTILSDGHDLDNHDGGDMNTVCWECAKDILHHGSDLIIHTDQPSDSSRTYAIELPGCCWTTEDGTAKLRRGFCLETKDGPVPAVDTSGDCQGGGGGGFTPVGPPQDISGSGCALNKGQSTVFEFAFVILAALISGLSFKSMAAKRIRRK